MHARWKFVAMLLSISLGGCGSSLAAPHGRSPTPALPHGFSTISDLLHRIDPVVQKDAGLTVLLPRSIPNDVPQTGHKWDAAYSASKDAYSVEVYGGPPLPVNSPNAPQGGMRFVMLVRGATTMGGLNNQFGSLTAWQPNAAQGQVSLGHGITATNFTTGTGHQTKTSVSWHEDGWTFVLLPTTDQPSDKLAAGIAQSSLGLHLPGTSGTAVFAVAPDTPSYAVFKQGAAWYSIYANRWQAATYASSMEPLR